MAEIRWTEQAADDVEAVVEYIALDSEHYAKLFAIDIIAVIEGLKLSPKRGRIVPELSNDSIREIFFGSYRIIYRIENLVVELLTIYHSARQLTPDDVFKRD